MTEPSLNPGDPPPVVSVVMATFNAAAYLADALRSVLAQTLPGGLEVIAVDDASTDAGPAILQAIAATDPRLRVIACATNGGPAAARNLALDAARGAWVAVVDADDLLHPDRLARLFAAAEAGDADIVADDLLLFSQDGATPPRLLLGWKRPREIGLAAYIRSNALQGRAPCLGYLKPLIRRALLLRTGLRYDPTLRNGEDSDLVTRLLAEGGRMLVVPEPWYFYRRHGASISHRLSAAKIAAMEDADRRFRAVYAAALTPEVTAALDTVRASHARAAAWDRFQAALKARDPGAALAEARAHPAVLGMLRGPVLARLQRLATGRARRPARASGRRHVVLLTRQRVVGNTNGSSVYLLSLVEALRGAGCDIGLVCPSPAMFGRWPWVRLLPEMAVFSTIAVRGALRIGPWLVATDPRVALRAAGGVLGRALSRLGLPASRLLRPAPYSIGVPWQPADRVFVAAHAGGRADAVLCDYAFLAEGIPYALNPAAPSAIVQHDLFHPRAALFAATGNPDSVVSLDAATEWAMLARADAVIAIQAQEADATRAALPADKAVILAPMAITPVARPQPGQDNTLLFVGSNTAPNVEGLAWLLEHAWPRIRAAAPAAVLTVAGSVCGRLGAVPEGVRPLGLVPDLAPLYAAAGVVVSPLHTGSGLKIKLVEAMGHGKAIVATPVTMQGVESLGGTAVLVEEDPARFADAVLSLLADPARRAVLAEAALAAARARFSASACYAEAVAFLAGAATPAPAALAMPQAAD